MLILESRDAAADVNAFDHAALRCPSDAFREGGETARRMRGKSSPKSGARIAALQLAVADLNGLQAWFETVGVASRQTPEVLVKFGAAG